MCNGYLGRQMPSLWMSPLPSSFPSFYRWARHHVVWDIPLVSWGQLSWLCFFTASFLPPSQWPLGTWEERGRESLDTVQALFSSSQNAGMLLTLLATNAKHSTLWAAVKQVNFITSSQTHPVPSIRTHPVAVEQGLSILLLTEEGNWKSMGLKPLENVLIPVIYRDKR